MEQADINEMDSGSSFTGVYRSRQAKDSATHQRITDFDPNDNSEVEQKASSYKGTAPFSFTIRGKETYTVYLKIDIAMREEMFKQTGLWLYFPPGETQIEYSGGKGYFGGVYLTKASFGRYFFVKVIHWTLDKNCFM